MGSRRANGPWGSNLVFKARPPEDDGLVAVVTLDKNRWHAGGLAALGDILAIPVYGDGLSEVVFLHVAEPESPTRFPASVLRLNNARANAVALAKLADQRFVCAVWWEDEDQTPKGRIDFYVSKDTNFINGFQSGVFTWVFTAVGRNHDRDPKYQAIGFVTPKDWNQHADGLTRLYLIGTENEAVAAPLENGRNLADLFEVRIASDMFGDRPNGERPQIRWVNTREFRCSREFANLDAAGGVYVSMAGELSLYGGYHWRVDNTFRFAEFPARPDPDVPVSDLARAWVDLFEHDTFRGGRLGIYGTDESVIPDYRQIFVRGNDFDEIVSSIRYQIPEGHTYRLYKDPAFGGSFTDLKGKGTMVEIPDLKRSRRRFGDQISSSRYV
jgi:hypothetical protein